MKITNIDKFKVIVPSRPDSVNSVGVEDPMHMLALEGKPAWQVQFDQIYKYIYRIRTDHFDFPLPE